MNDDQNIIKPTQPQTADEPMAESQVRPVVDQSVNPSVEPSVPIATAPQVDPVMAQQQVAPEVAQPVSALPQQPVPMSQPAMSQPASDQTQVMPNVAAPVKKKRSKKLFIVVAIIFILSGASLAYLFLMGDDNDTTTKSTNIQSSQTTESEDTVANRTSEKDKLSDTRATTEMNKLAQELEVYYNENSYYPSKLSALTSLTESDITDEYGEMYVYAPLNCEGTECTKFNLVYEYYQDNVAEDTDGSGSIIKKSIN